jgi:hypothetical protein
VTYDAIRPSCKARIELATPRRRANALNLEVGQPADRCSYKTPAHWPEGMWLRWIGSGGDATVLGTCSRDCPRVKP